MLELPIIFSSLNLFTTVPQKFLAMKNAYICLLAPLLTGITPCYAVLMAVLKDPEDRTAMTLIFANQTEEDILLTAELDALASNHPDRFKVSDVY